MILSRSAEIASWIVRLLISWPRIALIDRIDRLRQHEERSDEERDDRHCRLHRLSPRSRLRGISRARAGSSVTDASGGGAAAREASAPAAGGAAAGCDCFSNWSSGR